MLQESTPLPVAYMIPCVRFVWVVRRWCLSFPVTQHSVRVAGYSLPDRDSHPARNTRLCLAHT